MYTPENIFWETNAIIYTELLSNVSMACLGVVLIAFILLISLRATAIITIIVIYVDLILVGEMWLLDIPVNTVSVVNLVLAFGLSVDYSMHVMHAFLSTRGPSRAWRIESTMLRIAAAVLLATFSTLIGVLVLGASRSHIMRVFFKLLCGTIVFGGLSGLVLLPVVLSLIGPRPCLAEDEEEAVEEDDKGVGVKGDAGGEQALLIPTSELSEIGRVHSGVPGSVGSKGLSGWWRGGHSQSFALSPPAPSPVPFYSGNPRPDSKGHLSPRRHRFDPSATLSSAADVPQPPLSRQTEGYSRLYQVHVAPPSSTRSHRSSFVYTRCFAWMPAADQHYTNEAYDPYSQNPAVASVARRDAASAEEAPASDGSARYGRVPVETCDRAERLLPSVLRRGPLWHACSFVLEF
jgi:hypothetical protein